MATQDHLVHQYTRIILKLTGEQIVNHTVKKGNPLTANDVRVFGENIRSRTERVALIMELLAVRGFSFRTGKDVVYAETTDCEAQAAKYYLLENGIQDREFQVYSEFTRKWGIM
jgi:hypothetical protein